MYIKNQQCVVFSSQTLLDRRILFYGGGIDSPMNTGKEEYLVYLAEHIENVKRAWYEILRPSLMQHDNLTDRQLFRIDEAIEHHDESKYGVFEFEAYCNHFYPDKEPSASLQKQWDDEFEYAWLHHQHCNPHHWQYWVLRNDEDGRRMLDMPFEQICAMICDWHSFSAKDENSIAYSWYVNHSHEMLLSQNTREVLEELLEYVQEPLTPLKEDFRNKYNLVNRKYE